MYEDCKLYGPYTSKKDGRLRCIIVHPDGHKQTISYPKYIIEKYLNRYLEENETIDHIDGNFLNNDLSNLRVIDRKQHAIEDAIRNKNIIVSCKMCGKTFEIQGNLIHGRNRTDKHQSGYFCSKQCTERYGRYIQLGYLNHTTIDKVVASKYKVKSALKEILNVEVG